MNNRIITREYLRENPNHVFVFGDNLDRVGHGGAAQLRDEPNTYGFVTKKSIAECYTIGEYGEVLQVELAKLLAEINANLSKTYLISRLGAGLANDHRIWEKLIRAELIARLKHFPNVKLLFDTEPVLVMRTCLADMRSSRNYSHFVWPESGYVEAPDWDGGKAVCGHKLHGLLNGKGDGSLLCWDKDAKWLIVEVFADDGLVELDNCKKVGFRCGYVVHCGDRCSAPKYLADHGHNDRVVSGTATTGDSGTATVGDRGTATAGYRGTATAGYRGTATAGYRGTATAGVGGTATAGDRGTATAGDDGVISIQYWDGTKYRRKIAVVGENGIKPNVKYRLNDANEFEEVA